MSIKALLADMRRPEFHSYKDDALHAILSDPMLLEEAYEAFVDLPTLDFHTTSALCKSLHQFSITSHYLPPASKERSSLLRALGFNLYERAVTRVKVLLVVMHNRHYHTNIETFDKEPKYHDNHTKH